MDTLPSFGSVTKGNFGVSCNSVCFLGEELFHNGVCPKGEEALSRVDSPPLKQTVFPLIKMAVQQRDGMY